MDNPCTPVKIGKLRVQELFVFVLSDILITKQNSTEHQELLLIIIDICNLPSRMILIWQHRINRAN